MTTNPSDSVLKQKIRSLISSLDCDKTICPSQVARELDSENWRALMPRIRDCADELSAIGVVSISQKGKVISSARNARGPIRLGRTKQ